MPQILAIVLLLCVRQACLAAPHIEGGFRHRRAPAESSCTDALCVLSEALSSQPATSGPPSSASSATVTATSGSSLSGTITPGPTSTGTSSSVPASATSYPCYHAADPDSGATGLGWCECDGYTNTFPLMLSIGANTGTAYQPCAYTTVPALPSSSNPPSSTVPATSSAVSNALPTQCTDGASPDASCFNALDLPDYILHWWSANSGSCGQQAFAACFYAKNTKYASSDCGQLNNDAACTEPVWNDFVGTTNGQKISMLHGTSGKSTIQALMIERH